MNSIVEGCRKAFNDGTTRPLSWRRKQLENLLKLLEENTAAFVAALGKDLRKPEQESLTLEIEYTKNVIRGFINYFEDWAKDEYVEKNILTMLDQTYIHYDPLGVVLVIGAWNYPLQLSLAPFAGAISAGNAVILKPSELAPESSKLMEELIPKYLDPSSCKVISGGVPETTELLKEKFDHIFFTGSTHVGKIIREASNKHLTPVTLELGGKSPVYVCESADLVITAKRLLWAKMINLGQTCIAPDYVLCSPDVQKKLVEKLTALVTEWYGEDPQKSDNLCRIVNRRNFDRLEEILNKTRGKVVGGKVDENDLFIEPTFVTGVKNEDSTMQTELFGPILPFVNVKDQDEAVDFINARDKPLTLYIFTKKKVVEDTLKMRTSSGSIVINDAIVHLSVDTLPFGGVGPSGMGSYHGKYSFQTFSHRKSVLARDFSMFGEALGASRYPPYSMDKVNRTNMLVKNRKIPKMIRLIPYISCFLLGLSTSFLINYFSKKNGSW